MFKDTIHSRRTVTASCRLHLHPDAEIVAMGRRDVDVVLGGGKFKICFAGDGMLVRQESFYCCEFGKKLPNDALVFTTEGKEMQFACCIAKTHSNLQVDLSKGATVGEKEYEW